MVGVITGIGYLGFTSEPDSTIPPATFHWFEERSSRPKVARSATCPVVSKALRPTRFRMEMRLDQQDRQGHRREVTSNAVNTKFWPTTHPLNPLRIPLNHHEPTQPRLPRPPVGRTRRLRWSDVDCDAETLRIRRAVSYAPDAAGGCHQPMPLSWLSPPTIRAASDVGTPRSSTGLLPSSSPISCARNRHRPPHETSARTVYPIITAVTHQPNRVGSIGAPLAGAVTSGTPPDQSVKTHNVHRQHAQLMLAANGL